MEPELSCGLILRHAFQVVDTLQFSLQFNGSYFVKDVNVVFSEKNIKLLLLSI